MNLFVSNSVYIFLKNAAGVAGKLPFYVYFFFVFLLWCMAVFLVFLNLIVPTKENPCFCFWDLILILSASLLRFPCINKGNPFSFFLNSNHAIPFWHETVWYKELLWLLNNRVKSPYIAFEVHVLILPLEFYV